MVTEGEMLDSFPDGPVSRAALSKLEDDDTILTAVPLITEAHGPKELSDRVVIQTESTAIVAVYEESWTVEHRVDGTDRDPDDVLEDAMIAGQGDSALVESPEE